MRTIKVDQSICSKFEEHSKHSSAAQIGLLIGSIGDDTRDSVVAVIATPSFEEGQQAIEISGASTGVSKKGKTPKASPEPQVQIKADWIIEHASQVAPLIPGGLGIVGLFVCGPEACFSAAMAKLCGVIVSLRSSNVLTGDAAVLTVAAPSGKLSAKELSASASSVAALKSCDCRSAPVLSSYITVRTMYGLGAAFTVTSVEGPLSDALKRTVRAEKDGVGSAVVALGALRMLDASTPVAELCSQGEETLEAFMLTPPPCSSASGQQSGQARGRTALRGAITGRALVHKRDTWATAAAALKADLVRSLEARLSVLLTDAEEADAGEDEARSPLLQRGDAAYGAPQSCSLPQRAILPAQAPMLFSEYCLYGRDASQVLSTAHEVLGLSDFQEDQVEWPEESASEQSLGAWDPLAVQAKSSAKLPEVSQKAGSAPLNDTVCMLMGVGGAVALALAVGTAWVYMGS